MDKQTTDLLDLMKNARNYETYLQSLPEGLPKSFMKIDRALSSLLVEKKLKKSDVIAGSGIEIHYAYQIFSGVKTPTRDKVIMLCIGMKLSEEETQRLLKISGYPLLYAKNGRDNVLLFGLMQKKTLIDINALLYDNGFDILE